MMKVKILTVTLAVLSVLHFTGLDTAADREGRRLALQSSHTLQTAVVGCAGAPTMTAAHTAVATVGQPTPIGMSSTADKKLYAGFLAALDGAAGPVGPLVPTDCAVTDSLCDMVHVSWLDNSDDEDGFKVYRNGHELGTVPGDSTCYDDNTAQACSVYDYCVTAYNAQGESDCSSTDTGSRLGPPIGPTACEASDDNPGKVHLAWTNNASGVCRETGFNIYRDGALLDSVGAGVTGYDDWTAMLDTTYDYCVMAYNACGESAGSCCDAGTRSAGPDFYALPGGLRASQGQVGFLLPITGRNSLDIKGYSVCVQFNPEVFMAGPAIIDTVGTCAVGSFMPPTYSSTDTTVTVGVVYATSCPPEIPAGDHPPDPPYIYFVLDVKPTAPLGPTLIEIKDVDLAKNRTTDCTGFTVTPSLIPGTVEIINEQFIRGDDDGDGELTISDPILSLCAQFDSCHLRCFDASDVDDNGEINISDPIYNLSAQFGAGPVPPPPFPGCGLDPTPDDIDCKCHPHCMDCGALLAESNAEVRIWLGVPENSGVLQVVFPLYLETDGHIWGFDCTVSYPPSALAYVGMEREAETLTAHDFLSARQTAVGSGLIRIGDVVSLDLSGSLEPGVHEVGRLVFRRLGNNTDMAEKVEAVRGKFVAVGASVGEVSVGAPAGAGLPVREPIRTISLSVVPNPSTATVTIRYGVPVAGFVEVSIYNISGQCVRTLVRSTQLIGRYEAFWNGQNELGRDVPDGIYFCRVKVPGSQETLKLVVVR